jgi:hypothetical protein
MPALISFENWVPLKPMLGCVWDVALIPYPSCIDSIKLSLQFSSNFVVINNSEGSFCFKFFILHNSRCQVICGSCKKLPCTSLQCCYIFLVVRVSLMAALLSVENWVTLKQVLRGGWDVALIHYPSWTDSIPPSLQFSSNFVVINASEGSLFQIFEIWPLNRKWVLTCLWLLCLLLVCSFNMLQKKPRYIGEQTG